MITPETIADIRAALDVATPGPWKCLDRRAGNLTAGYSVWQDLERPYADSPYGKQVCLTPDGSQLSNRKNMELICLLRNHTPALLDEIERLRKENDLQHSQLLNHAQNVLPDRDATIERLRARVKELEAERDEQNAVLREATQKLVELNVKNAVLKEKLRTAEDFNENYTVIDDIGPLPKCFHCAHQQSMAFRGPDAPCYQCGIDKGYPKFKADKP